jgi:hypothetical protein
MNQQPVPMNRSQRRKAGVKIAPETVPFTLALLNRREQTSEDGTVFAQSYFRIVAPDGRELMEELPDGESAPVIIASVPQRIRKEVIVRGPALVK